MIAQCGQFLVAGTLLIRRLGLSCSNQNTGLTGACFHAGRAVCWPEVVVPPLGESVSEGTISTLLKKVGDNVAVDEAVAQLETDKVTIDCKSQHSGTVTELKVKIGDTVKPGDVIGIVGDQAGKPAPSKAEQTSKPAAPAAAKVQQPSSKQSRVAAAELHPEEHGRVPMIRFPTRVLPDGRRVSDLIEAEAGKLTPSGAHAAHAAAAVQSAIQKTDGQQAPKPTVSSHKTTTQQTKEPPSAPRPPASPNTEYLEEVPSRRALTQREIDIINLGGAL